ncbi:hypothetical protein WMY93_034004 [Mugilogobius chulae]|uniref:Uncharacterized protein n=1 Tax=Mugilogobius chulae TaxID=88201 RepID=A0AAW0MRU7_9GOBI
MSLLIFVSLTEDSFLVLPASHVSPDLCVSYRRQFLVLQCLMSLLIFVSLTEDSSRPPASHVSPDLCVSYRRQFLVLKDSSSSFRSSVSVACLVLRLSDDSLVRSRSISCLQQLHMFCPAHVDLRTLVPCLCGILLESSSQTVDLSRSSLALRRSVVSCLRQIVQRDAGEVCELAVSLVKEQLSKDSSVLECTLRELGLEGALFSLLDRESDPGLRQDLNQTLGFMMVSSLSGGKVGQWLRLCRDVLSATTDHGDAQDSPDDEEEREDWASFGARSETLSPFSALRWSTRLIAVESVCSVIQTCSKTGTTGKTCSRPAPDLLQDQDHRPAPGPGLQVRPPPDLLQTCSKTGTTGKTTSRPAPDHSKTGTTGKTTSRPAPDRDHRRSSSSSGGPDVLVPRLGDLVRMSFMASTDHSAPLRLAGLHTLMEIIRAFSSIQEPEFPGHFILEQYQANVGAALRPAFAPDAPPDVTAKACQVCSAWICSGVVRDLRDLKRVHQLLVSSLLKIQTERESNSHFTTKPQRQWKLWLCSRPGLRFTLWRCRGAGTALIGPLTLLLLLLLQPMRWQLLSPEGRASAAGPIRSADSEPSVAVGASGSGGAQSASGQSEHR